MSSTYRHKSDKRMNITDSDVITRVKSKCIIDDNGCWLWQGFTHVTGYGETSYKCCSIGTHRLMYQLHNGAIPEGMLVCHTCDVRNCCNPDHLWLGTLKDNFYDCMAKGRNGHKIKTHCPQGHEYSTENTYVSKVGHRSCKVCRRNRYRKQQSDWSNAATPVYSPRSAWLVLSAIRPSNRLNELSAITNYSDIDLEC